MTKEELVSKYPSIDTSGFEVDLYVFVALGVLIIVGMIIAGIIHIKRGSTSTGWVLLAGTVIVGAFWVLLVVGGSYFEKHRRSLEIAVETYKWEQLEFPEYLETVPYQKVEVIDYSFKDGYYDILIDQKGQPVVLSTSKIEPTAEDIPHAEARYVEGLSEYGIKDGYRDAIFYVPVSKKGKS